MSIIVVEARRIVANEFGQEPTSQFGPSELLYADDTLLMGVEAGPLTSYTAGRLRSSRRTAWAAT